MSESIDNLTRRLNGLKMGHNVKRDAQSQSPSDLVNEDNDSVSGDSNELQVMSPKELERLYDSEGEGGKRMERGSHDEDESSCSTDLFEEVKREIRETGYHRDEGKTLYDLLLEAEEKDIQAEGNDDVSSGRKKQDNLHDSLLPWEKGFEKWGNSNKFGRMQREVMDHFRLNHLDPQHSSAEELDYAARVEGQDFDDFEEEEDMRLYYPSLYKRMLELGDKRLLWEEMAQGLKIDTVQRVNETQTRMRNMTAEERRNIKIPFDAWTDYERRLKVDRWMQDHEQEIDFDRMEDILRARQNMSIEQAEEVMEKAREKYRHMAQNYLFMDNYFANADPMEFTRPRRSLTAQNYTWLLDIQVNLSRILTDMKLHDHVQAKQAFISISYHVKRLYNSEDDPEYRRIPFTELHGMKGVIDFFLTMGFEIEGDCLVIPWYNVDVYCYRQAMILLEEALNNKYFGMFESEIRYIDRMKALKGPDWEYKYGEPPHLPGFEPSNPDDYCGNSDDISNHIRRRHFQARLQRVEFGISESSLPDDLIRKRTKEEERMELPKLEDLLEDVRRQKQTASRLPPSSLGSRS